jgi:glycine hydroxymethyltransferase
MDEYLSQVDPDVSVAVDKETARQSSTLELIASENFTSRAVMQASGSVFTNKYAEGYPGRRYYGGCEFADQVERLAIERIGRLFGADHSNVQPHSGSQANAAAYLSVLNPGDKILGMDLSHGGHLTHGHPLNFSGRFFEVAAYGVDKETEQIDYDVLENLARAEKPAMIIAGASAYSRIIHFDRLAEISKSVGAFLMIDMAHIAGLIATGLHPSPVPYADFVTSTTHKTLRGPRGGLILCTEEHAKSVDRLVFPGLQGGPLVHIIAAKAVCFGEALQPDFLKYQQQVISNAKVLASTISNQGFRIVSGGTDTHLCLVDVFSRGLTGKQAEYALEEASITVNKNTIPFDKHPPMITSGIRIGTPALTTRGMKEEEMKLIGEWICKILNNLDSESVRKEVRSDVAELTAHFPLYKFLTPGNPRKT